MSDDAALAPLSTAAELWRGLVERGVLVPGDYDRDIVSVVDGQLPGLGSLLARMEIAQWTARDLLRAMAPVVDSFAGLLRDLLSLYSGIAASQATKSNLTVTYEFEQGDIFDQSLTQFRSAVDTLERAEKTRGAFVLSPQSWGYPAARELPGDSDVWRLRDESAGEWRFTLPEPPTTVDPALARGVSLVYSVLTAACDTLLGYGPTMHAVDNNVRLRDKGTGELEGHLRLYFAFADYFPETVIAQLRADVRHLESMRGEVIEKWLHDIEEWCSSFWDSDAGNAEAALASVLSLPMWGKRHEMYSAWVVCLIAEAFKSRSMQFEVVDGKLSFPFKATKIASFTDRDGSVELWSEVRSATSGELAHGRKGGVQPDYRFLRPGQAYSDTEMALEVKHYRRAAATRHGDTARDYARALPHARVTIVAHGPIGGTAMSRVADADQPRVTFRENVRSLASMESQALGLELNEAFPAAPYLQNVEVTRSAVDEVQVRLVTHGLDGKQVLLDQGPGLHSLQSTLDAEIVAEITCHPERWHTVDEARCRVVLTFSDGKVLLVEATEPNRSRSWSVGTLRNGSFALSSHARQSLP